jgi:hypothetical protein
MIVDADARFEKCAGELEKGIGDIPFSKVAEFELLINGWPELTLN